MSRTTLCAIGRSSGLLRPAVARRPRGRAGRHDRRHHRRRQGRAGRRHPGRHRPRRARAVGHAPTKRSRRPTDGSSCPACASAVRTRSRRRLPGFTPEAKNNITLSLGVTQDLDFTLKVANVAETITVVGQSDPVFSSGRTGAATAVMREDLATLPTISGRITDITRLTPQYGGSGTFAGQDNRANNMTVDGSYFNNSFGLGVTTGGIGDRTGVAPISLEAIEQVQVSVAPYDVRQGSFTGAGVNTVTRSGTNKFTALGLLPHAQRVVRRRRSGPCRLVGTRRARFNPNFTTHTAAWAGGPIVKNKLFAFGSYEKQDDTRPLTTFTSNPGGAPVGGNTTRVLRVGPRRALSSFLSTKFNYDTGPFDNITKITPAKPWMLKGDYNVNNANKVTFRYNQLDSSSRRQPERIGGARHAAGRPARRNFLTFANSNYAILENLKSGVGEWNSVFGNMTNNLLDRLHASRTRAAAQIDAVPVRRHRRRRRQRRTRRSASSRSRRSTCSATTRSSCRTASRSSRRTTRSPSAARSRSSTRTTRSTSASRAPTRTTRWPTSTPTRTATSRTRTARCRRSTCSIFQVKYLLQPGQTTPPLQPLDVDLRRRLRPGRVAAAVEPDGHRRLRVDVPKFGNTAFDNPVADALTFRDQDGSPVQVQHRRAAGHDAVLVAARRLQLGRERRPDDAGARRHRASSRASRRTSGSRTRSATPACCIGFLDSRQHDGVSVQPESGQVQAGADRRRGRQLRARRDRPELPLPADVAHQHRRRPPAAVGPGRHARLHLQPRPQRAGLHQRQPAGGRQAPTPASTIGRAGLDDAGAAPAPGITVALPACAAPVRSVRASRG